MIFYCKNCKKDFEIEDKKCETFWNWHCPYCGLISPKKDFNVGFKGLDTVKF
jgi:hypothetical protein